MRALAKACKRAGFVKVSGDLLEALLYLRDRVVLDEPRRVTTAKRMCYHLYTDASLEGGASGLGGILFNTSQLVINWFAETVCASLLETINPDGKEGFIYEMEVCAAVQGVCSLCTSLRSADIVLFCDNEAALAALIACKSDSPFVTAQLSELCNLEAALDLSIWFERVPSWGGLELTGDVGAGARWIVQAGRVLAQWASARGCWAQLGALFINGEQEMADSLEWQCSILQLGGLTVLLNCGWSESFDPKLLSPLIPHLHELDLIVLTHADFKHLGALPYLPLATS
eukprot:s4790_g1.t1